MKNYFPNKKEPIALGPLEIETDQQRRQTFLMALNRAWLIFGLVTLVFRIFMIMPQSGIYAIVLGSVTATYFLVTSLVRAERVWLGGLAFCSIVNLTFWGMFVCLIQMMGAKQAFSTEAPVLMLCGLPILFAGAVIHPKTAFVFATINTVLLIALQVTLAPEVKRPSVALFYWLLAVTVWLYERTLDTAHHRLHVILTNLEANVTDRTRSLQESIEQLKQTKTQLEEANKELKLFSYSVSHDLRSPLRAISGYSHMLSHKFGKEISPEASRCADRIARSASDMNRMLEGLLTLSRLGHHELRRARVDMEAMARQIAQSLSEADPDRFFQIKIGTLPRAQADAGLLESVFANLIGNAIKFSRHTTPSRIEIDWMKQNGEVVYFVRDNGAGFEMKYANKLFGVFERLHGSEFEGTGIGLATVKRSVQKHGGRIWAESTRNEGATFYFTLGDLSVGPELQSAEHSNVSENRDKFPRKLNSYDRTHCPSGMDLFRPMSVRMS